VASHGKIGAGAVTYRRSVTAGWGSTIARERSTAKSQLADGVALIKLEVVTVG